jgi:hypothetical protein
MPVVSSRGNGYGLEELVHTLALFEFRWRWTGGLIKCVARDQRVFELLRSFSEVESRFKYFWLANGFKYPAYSPVLSIPERGTARKIRLSF